MKTQNVLHLAFVGTLSTIVLLTLSPAAMAEPSTDLSEIAPKPARFDDSYVGAGISGGLTRSDAPGGGRTFGGNVMTRLTTEKAPVSLRGQLLFGNRNRAIVPTITYDYAVSEKVNIYGGVGYSFVQKKGVTSPVGPIGNRNAVVLNLGIESELAKGVVGYVDGKYGINAIDGIARDKSSLAISAGVGFKF